jgi:SAM-dependent methyltransferase
MNEKSLLLNYAEYYEKSSVIPQQDNVRELELFAGLIRGQSRADVLDLGCGEGRLAVRLAQQGHRVTAADVSPRNLASVQRLSAEHQVQINTITCNIEESIGPFGQNTYDIIYCMDVIEHLKSPVTGLSQIRKLLRPDGQLIIHTPNCFSLFRMLHYFLHPRRLVDYYQPANLGDLHFQTYDYLTIEKTLNFVGLKTNKILPTFTTLPLLSYLRMFAPLSRLLARLFPFWSDTLLLQCTKTVPIDVDRQIEFWVEQYKKGELKP